MLSDDYALRLGTKESGLVVSTVELSERRVSCHSFQLSTYDAVILPQAFFAKGFRPCDCFFLNVVPKSRGSTIFGHPSYSYPASGPSFPHFRIPAPSPKGTLLQELDPQDFPLRFQPQTLSCSLCSLFAVL